MLFLRYTLRVVLHLRTLPNNQENKNELEICTGRQDLCCCSPQFIGYKILLDFKEGNCERYVIRELSEISYKNNKLQCIEGGWSTWTTYKGTLARWTDEQIEILCVMLPFGISSGYILLFPRTPNKWILLLITFRLKVNAFISKYQYNP